MINWFLSLGILMSRNGSWSLVFFTEVLSGMEDDSFVASRGSFSKLARSRFETHCFLSNDSFKQIFMVSSRGMLVKNEVILRLAIKQSQFCWSISLAKSNESLTLYSLEVKSLSIGTEN